MTEDEMKTKRCCGPCPESTGNRMKNQPNNWQDIYLCSGSECAGWEPGEDIKKQDGIEGYLDGGVNLVRPTFKIIKTGDCGLKR